MRISFLRKQQIRKEDNKNVHVIFNDLGHFCGMNQPLHPSGTPAVDAQMWSYSWWGNFKRPVTTLFRSLFYFLAVSPLNWGKGGAGTHTGAAAVPIQAIGRAPNGPQVRPPIYLWPCLNEGMFGECWDTAMAKPACLARFNKPQLWRSTESVITRQRSTSRRGQTRQMLKAWWSASGRHYYHLLSADIKYIWKPWIQVVLLPCYYWHNMGNNKQACSRTVTCGA